MSSSQSRLGLCLAFFLYRSIFVPIYSQKLDRNNKAKARLFSYFYLPSLSCTTHILGTRCFLLCFDDVTRMKLSRSRVMGVDRQEEVATKDILSCLLNTLFLFVGLRALIPRCVVCVFACGVLYVAYFTFSLPQLHL